MSLEGEKQMATRRIVVTVATTRSRQVVRHSRPPPIKAARTHQPQKDLEPGGPNEEVLLEPNNEDVEVVQGETKREDSLPSHPAVGPTSKKKGTKRVAPESTTVPAATIVLSP